ncbi:hypothetical protein ACWDE0_40155 [Streptomyces sp. 900105755]
MDASTAALDFALRAAHERFTTSPGMPSGVRDLVAESWRRSARCGVPADGSVLPSLTTPARDLRAYRHAHPLAVALPMLREVLGAGATDDGHVFAVGDADGTLLWVEGDTGAIARAERMHFAEGAGWSERQAGTNALGTPLALGRAVQIVTGEHYSAAVHGWSCAAAPVRDPGTGRVLGVVDLPGGPTIATPPALAAVRAAALPLRRRSPAHPRPRPVTPSGCGHWAGTACCWSTTGARTDSAHGTARSCWRSLCRPRRDR